MEDMMKKRKRVNKRKFFSRIIFMIILIVIIVFFVKNITKKKDNKFAINVIVNNENITEKLVNNPYIDKDNVLYLSFEDIKNIFDPNIFYEPETNKIITTSGTKVAAINMQNNTLELNNASLILNTGIMDYGNNNYYLPISEMKNIYNVDAFTTENSGIINSLYNEFITIKTNKKVSIKKKTNGFSSTVQKVEQDKEIIYIADTEKKDWFKVLTFDRKYSDILRIRIYQRKNIKEWQ